MNHGHTRAFIAFISINHLGNLYIYMYIKDGKYIVYMSIYINYKFAIPPI